MSGLEPFAIALAGPMGKLAWAGVKKCWVKYRKHKGSLGDHTSEVVEEELEKIGRIIGETYDRYANKLGAKFVQGDCEYSFISACNQIPLLILFSRQGQT